MLSEISGLRVYYCQLGNNSDWAMLSQQAYSRPRWSMSVARCFPFKCRLRLGNGSACKGEGSADFEEHVFGMDGLGKEFEGVALLSRFIEQVWCPCLTGDQKDLAGGVKTAHLNCEVDAGEPWH